MEGFSPIAHFIRDRSRAVRNDFTMQHETGALAIECHERCARFHILALHFERDRPGFSVALEEQQLMNSGYLATFVFGREVLTVSSPSKSQRVL
jgi:nuclear mRNA export protein SAC3